MKIGLLGGCFNPIHNGHLRLAIEAGEALGLDRVELMPAAVPPHKRELPMLPFELRATLAEAAVSGIAGLAVNRIEASLDGPSYTVQTLTELNCSRPDDVFTFILGSGDLFMMPQWHRGLEIATLADIAVAGRDNGWFDAVRRFVGETWPEAVRHDEAWDLPGGRTLSWIPARRMDLSSSDVRKRWLQAKPVRGLVPQCVEEALNARREEVEGYWRS